MLLSALYLLSFAVLPGWFVLLLVGLLRPEAMALANGIALPVLVGSALSQEAFRRSARRAERRLA